MGSGASTEHRYRVAGVNHQTNTVIHKQHHDTIENIIITNMSRSKKDLKHIHDTVKVHAVVLHTQCGADMDGNSKGETWYFCIF